MLEKQFPRIFVVGTGRSGTTILYKSLGCHSAVHTFPREMRFLIDPGGIMALLDALTVRYHPVMAREALYHFERLMRVYLAVPEREPYRGFNVPAWIGEPYYWQRLDEFCDALVDLEFDGTAWQVEPQNEGRLVTLARQLTRLRQTLFGSHQAPFRLSLPRPTLKSVKSFPDRSELVSLAAEFIDDLFLHAAHAHGKGTWCEKTPQNLLNLDFIFEMFPKSVIIHIKRDPRGVVHSMTKQFWAPSDLQDACLFMRPVYERWNAMRSMIDLDRYCYLELKLEEFAAEPELVLESIASASGLSGTFTDLPEVALEKVDNWQKSMSCDDRQIVNDLLGEHIHSMGYDL